MIVSKRPGELLNSTRRLVLSCKTFRRCPAAFLLFIVSAVCRIPFPFAPSLYAGHHFFCVSFHDEYSQSARDSEPGVAGFSLLGNFGDLFFEYGAFAPWWDS